VARSNVLSKSPFIEQGPFFKGPMKKVQDIQNSNHSNSKTVLEFNLSTPFYIRIIIEYFVIFKMVQTSQFKFKIYVIWRPDGLARSIFFVLSINFDLISLRIVQFINHCRPHLLRAEQVLGQQKVQVPCQPVKKYEVKPC
jgi:hypothetical protein